VFEEVVAMLEDRDREKTRSRLEQDLKARMG
jgi:hypothetical protein